MATTATQKKDAAPDSGSGNGKRKYVPGQKTRWAEAKVNREIDDLPRKINLARQNIPIMVKSPIVAYLTGVALKTIDTDRLKGKGIKFRADEKGQIYYDLRDVLRHIEGPA